MPAKIAIYIAQKLADERTRKIIITIIAVLLSIIFYWLLACKQSFLYSP